MVQNQVMSFIFKKAPCKGKSLSEALIFASTNLSMLESSYTGMSIRGL